MGVTMLPKATVVCEIVQDIEPVGGNFSSYTVRIRPIKQSTVRNVYFVLELQRHLVVNLGTTHNRGGKIEFKKKFLNLKKNTVRK